jgi:hypothetical protein
VIDQSTAVIDMPTAEKDRLLYTQHELKIDSDLLQYYNYGFQPTPGKNNFGLGFGGSCDALDDESFVENAVKMYTDDDYWRDSLHVGFEILMKRHGGLTNERVLLREITKTQ